MGKYQKNIEAARQISVVQYLETYRPGELVRKTDREYCTRSHDSLIITIGNGKFHWYGNKPYPIAAVESTKQIEKAIDVMREISPIPVLPKNEVEGFCYDAERQELVFCAAIPPQELLQRLPAEIVMAAAESAYAGISENELLRQTAAISVEVCGRLGLPMPPDAVQTLEGMKEHIPDGEERRALEKVRETAVTFGDAVCKRLKLERGQPAPQREER